MTKDELSLLLYLEACAVDHGGKVEAIRMNEGDFDIAERWKRTGFIQFGRIFADAIRKSRGRAVVTNWVVLSESAWQAAHAERRARALRMFEQRKHEFNGVEA